MKKYTRRDFLRLSAMTAAGAAVVACQPQTVVVEKEKVVTKVVEVEKEVTKIVAGTPVVEKVIETKVVEVEKEVEKVVEVAKVSSRQSPMLQERVKAGKLPPLDDRLPLDPLVVTPLEEIGEYGGTLAMQTIYADVRPTARNIDDMNLLRIAPDISSAVPNVASGWEVSHDGKTITIRLRAGMKWSDGEPFTADDVVYWYEAVFLNEELVPWKDTGLCPGGEPLKVVKLDDYTFQYQFAAPSATFVVGRLAHHYGFWNGHWQPAHYLKQFHIEYNRDAQKLADEAGFDYWHQLYNDRRGWHNLEYPRLRVWETVNVTPDAVFGERNPYFWAVDTEGNQLPYIDKTTVDRLTDIEIMNANIVAGKYDWASRHNSVENINLYKENADAGGYRVLLWDGGYGSRAVYNFNMTYDKDPVLRDIHRDKRYRQALSLAINRDEINKVVFYNTARPRQLTVTPMSRFFKQEYEDAYAEYDPERANALLDEMGLEWDENHELRLRPDGKPMKIAWDVYLAEVVEKGPITELCRKYWKAIGIEMINKEMTRQLLSPKVTANEEPMSLWHGDECNDILFALKPKWFAPMYGDESCWGQAWGIWHLTGGTHEQSEEPPEEIKQLYEWMDKYNETGDEEWAHKLLQSQAENIWTLGVIGMAPHPVIVRKNLRNVAEKGMWNWDSQWAYPYFPCHWFFKGGSRAR